MLGEPRSASMIKYLGSVRERWARTSRMLSLVARGYYVEKHPQSSSIHLSVSQLAYGRDQRKVHGVFVESDACKPLSKRRKAPDD